jgi:hypothetical protein
MKHAGLDDLIQELFSGRRRPHYGISLVSIAPDLSMLQVEFRFLKGHIYCCAEPFCHLPIRCDKLLRLASERSISLPNNITVRWRCIVEEGARLECLRELGLPDESKGYEFVAVSRNPAVVSGPPERTTADPPPGFTGLWVIKRPDARIETEYENGVANGHFRWSQKNPPPGFTGLWTVNRPDARIESEYVDGVPNGIFRERLPSGACLREGYKKHGLWHGHLITRDRHGNVLDISEFNEGTGIYRIFDSTGLLTDEVMALPRLGAAEI